MADSATVSEDSGVVVIGVLTNDTDENSDDTKRVVSVSSPGVRGIIQVASGGRGVIFYANEAYESMKEGETAIETFSYTMADRKGLQSTANVVVTVTGSNDGPTARADIATVPSNVGSVTIDVLANDTDVDADDSKSVAAVDGRATPGWLELIIIYGVGVGVWHPGTPAIQGSLSIAPHGQSVVYSPGDAFQSLAAGESATEAFRYTITDGAGAQSTASVTVTVTGVENPAPAPAAEVAVARPAPLRLVNIPAAVSLTTVRQIS